MRDDDTDFLGAIPGSGGALSVVTIDSDKDWLTYDITNVGKLEATRTDTPAGTLVSTISGKYIADAQANVVNTGLYGYVEDTGSNAMGTGHIIGGLFHARNLTTSLIEAYGGEGRMDLRSTQANVSGTGMLGLGNFEGTTFQGALNGMIARGEVYAADGTTPLAEGTVTGLYVPAIIGGANAYGIWSRSQIRLDSALYLFDDTGTNYGYFQKFLATDLFIASDNSRVNFFSNDIVMPRDFVLDTTTGSKVGTATNQKLGFYNATPIVQPVAVADATGAGDVVAQLNALLARVRTLGLIAT